ncbi:MAG: hypothetical protein PHP88_01230 [bacterium]|nr:hypothetical protein [bacterium]
MLIDLSLQLKKLETTREEPPRQGWMRIYLSVLRNVLRYYAETVSVGGLRSTRLSKTQAELLHRLASMAFDELGGQPDPPTCSLKHYDHMRFGPYLGVSGEGEAAPAIRDAALLSPKVRALGLKRPIEVGVAHDAERLGSVGELPVGPDEYRDIRLECLGRILTSTNIGARLNLRFYARQKVVWVNEGPLRNALKQARRAAAERVAPFLRTPDGRPRPLTVYVQFRVEVQGDVRVKVLRGLSRSFFRGEIGEPRYHRVGLLAKVPRGKDGFDTALGAIDTAYKAGVSTVAIEGIVRSAAEDLVSMPGLLQYFHPGQAQRLLDYAQERKVHLTSKNIVDTETVARHAWTGLALARHVGLELGKYGLFPLTFEESDEVIRSVQRWLHSWTAAPAFYVDVPFVMGNRVFTTRDMPEAIRVWLKRIARHGVSVVLIDTVDKSKGRRLMKQGPKDGKGILTQEEIQALIRFARRLDIKVLWAGGITLEQAYKFGRMNAFGIYVTSAATTLRPVTSAHERDIGLAAERLPTREGVAQAKLLLEAGFLVENLAFRGLAVQSGAIGSAAQAVLEEYSSAASHRRGSIQTARQQLDKLVFEGWKKYSSVLGSRDSSQA